MPHSSERILRPGRVLPPERERTRHRGLRDSELGPRNLAHVLRKDLSMLREGFVRVFQRCLGVVKIVHGKVRFGMEMRLCLDLGKMFGIRSCFLLPVKELLSLYFLILEHR